jgi:hypothetical protein
MLAPVEVSFLYNRCQSGRQRRKTTPLDTQSIIAELEAERDRLNAAIEALQGSRRKRGRPAGKTDGRRRHLSAAARKRIGEAMKKRWAERKKKAA